MQLTRYFSDFLTTLIYPHNCCGCGYHLPHTNQVLCWKCINQMPFTGFEKKPNNLVEQVFAGRMPLQRASSLLFFKKDSLTQQLLHQLKYRGRQDLGVYLGKLIGKAINDAGWEIDCIVPLPLNKKKLAKRGYNQAEVLANGISEATGKPIEKVAVIRTKNNATQTNKNRVERWENVSEVFDLQIEYTLHNKHILLIDDVLTTGATLEACGQVLLQIPGAKLSIATAAFASKI
jgi:ComF family protein